MWTIEIERILISSTKMSQYEYFNEIRSEVKLSKQDPKPRSYLSLSDSMVKLKMCWFT